MVADGVVPPIDGYVELIAASRFLGHGQPWLQAEQSIYWTAAATIVAEAQAEADEILIERRRSARGT